MWTRSSRGHVSLRVGGGSCWWINFTHALTGAALAFGTIHIHANALALTICANESLGTHFFLVAILFASAQEVIVLNLVWFDADITKRNDWICTVYTTNVDSFVGGPQVRNRWTSGALVLLV